jgi:hypothetical protein
MSSWDLPPETLQEALERSGRKLQGWYAESAEGALSDYSEDADDSDTEFLHELEQQRAAGTLILG